MPITVKPALNAANLLLRHPPPAPTAYNIGPAPLPILSHDC